MKDMFKYNMIPSVPHPQITIWLFLSSFPLSFEIGVNFKECRTAMLQNFKSLFYFIFRLVGYKNQSINDSMVIVNSSSRAVLIPCFKRHDLGNANIWFLCKLAISSIQDLPYRSFLVFFFFFYDLQVV